MDEVIFIVLVMLFCGPALWASSWHTLHREDTGSARALERQRWRALWQPLVPAGVLLSALLGWWLVEPDRAESLPWTMAVGAVPFGTLFARASIRSIWALVHPIREIPVGTVGLLRPRILLSRHFREAVDREVLAAAYAHEEAHARHRDPLRIWLAQLATDLQWPCSAAQARFCAWLEALEMARDEEARLAGAEGADLAAAILACVRLSGEGLRSANTSLISDGQALRKRIARLIEPLCSSDDSTEAHPIQMGKLVPFLVACILGLTFGEALIGAALKALP